MTTNEKEKLIDLLVDIHEKKLTDWQIFLKYKGYVNLQQIAEIRRTIKFKKPNKNRI